MADNARKAVVTALLDTWSRGPSILGVLDSVSGGRSNLGPVVRGGDSVDIPNKSAATVNTSETAAVNASALGTPDVLTVNRPKFINEAITQAQYNQLLNGGGNYANQLARSMGADMLNALDKDMVDYLLQTLAWDTSATYHVNVAADAITDGDVADAETLIREQDGIANTNSGLFWLLSPRAAGGIKQVSEFVPNPNASAMGEVGMPMVGMVNGIPAFYHNAIPGRVDSLRQQGTSTAVSISSNVATITMVAGHGFVPGQKIWTSGLTTNIAVGSAAAITSVTSTQIVVPLSAGDGAFADGAGTIYSGSAMAMLVYAPWVFYGLDGVAPYSDLVKREGAAGWTAQLFHHFGRVGHAGAVVVLHGLG